MRIVPMREPYENVNVIVDPAAREKWRADTLEYCMICGCSPRVFGPLQVHHMAGGSVGRSDEPCNFLKVCRVCHDTIHKGEITIEAQLQCKKWRDEGHYDKERVLKLKGFAKEALTAKE